MNHNCPTLLFENGYLVMDNFFDTAICEELRSLALNTQHFEDIWPDYKAVNYQTGVECSNKEITNLVNNIVPKIIEERFPFLCKNNHGYQRGWYFVHDCNQFHSVKRHYDRGDYHKVTGKYMTPLITANIWVTPNECIEDTSLDYNGFTIHTPRESVTIPYQYNRLSLFFSEIQHESQLSRFKQGQKKVNFTFLYGQL